MLKKLLIFQANNVSSLLLILRSCSLGLLLLVAYLAQFFPDAFFAQSIQWPLLLACVGLAILQNSLHILLKRFSQAAVYNFFALNIDAVIWLLAIYATGGAINPAIGYVLVIFSVAALSFPVWQTVISLLLMLSAYLILLSVSPHQHHAMMLNWHLWGMWILFVINALILFWVINRMRGIIAEQDKTMAQLREQQIRDEKLVAMGALSASIAHELGTPLSTIAVLVEDDDDEQGRLIQSQITRCKQALEKLKQGVEQQSVEQSSAGLIKQLKSELLLLKPLAELHWADEVDATLITSPLLEHALLALLVNAVDAEPESISVALCADNSHLVFTIAQMGSKIATQELVKLGREPVNSKQGLGMGYYIANASIEKLGGKVLIQNLSEGVSTRVDVPYCIVMKP